MEEQPKLETNENFELESQFFLRLPSLPAASLRAAIRSGANLNERLTIQIEQDMRNGMVRFDGWYLPAKLVDLPTVLESYKTLDNNNFYKTADINQMMICKEENEESKEDSEEIGKKTKDGRDKKYLYPHGITKPLKNVRKRRFRKTLKKKYIDFPEIEKEVKRLLKQDNDAINVRFEFVNEENKNEDKDKDKEVSNVNTIPASYDVELFGDVVSSSDDEERVGYSDEGSRMSGNFRDYLKEEDGEKSSENNYTFSEALNKSENESMATTDPTISMEMNAGENDENSQSSCSNIKNTENELTRIKMQELESKIQSLQTQIIAQQIELDNIENMALKQRFQANIDDLNNKLMAKKKELENLEKSPTL